MEPLTGDCTTTLEITATLDSVSQVSFRPQLNITIQLKCREELSLLHSQLLGTSFTNVFTHTHKSAADQDVDTFDTLS